MRAWIVAATVVAVLGTGASHGETAESADVELAAALREGGLVLFVRTSARGCAADVVAAAARGLRSLEAPLARVVAPRRCTSAIRRATGRRPSAASLDRARTLRALLRRPARGNTLAVGATGVDGARKERVTVFRGNRVLAEIPSSRWGRLEAARRPPSPFRSWAVPRGTHPHDVAPAASGVVWYTAQFSAALGRLDPATGAIRHIPLGTGSSPHGVIVGPDGAPWITDSGLNAIVRVDPVSEAVRVFPMPVVQNVDLNTAVFAGGVLWFTGNAGWYGRLDPATAEVRLWAAPRGAGPYGITATPSGDVYYASLQGSYVGRIDTATGGVTVLEPPSAGQGARRVWSDSRGRIWVSEWNAGKLAMYDPAGGGWREWSSPQVVRPYAVYVDDGDVVWLSDFGTNAIVRFDPATETFTSFSLPRAGAAVRQLLGRRGELWLPESGTDHVSVLPTG